MAISNHSIFIKNDKTIWGCGLNNYGQLGINNSTNQLTSVKIDIDDVKSISCGANHTIFLKNDGTVYGCGSNTYGQLGLGNLNNQLVPIKIDIDNVKFVGCGANHTVFIKGDGTAWSCGKNDYGELGIGSTSGSISTITQANINDVKFVCGGDRFTIFIKNDGTAYGCGRNNVAQLGIGSTTITITAITKIDIDNVKFADCGVEYTIFLKNDGTVYCCGRNNYGQLGINDASDYKLRPTKLDIDNINSISCGNYHTTLVKNDGTAYSCGFNSSGQLGLGNTTNQLIPVKIDIYNVKYAMCGNAHTMFLKNDGTVYGCGNNQYGQLDLNNTTNQTSLIKSNIDNVKNIFNQYVFMLVLSLIRDKNTYKTITDGLLEDLGVELPSIDIIKEKGIENLNNLLTKNEEGISLLDSLSDSFDILSYSIGDQPTLLKYDILPKPQIIKAKGDIGLSSFENINKVEVLTTGSGGIVKIAVSFDKGITWKTYIDGTWIDMSLDETTFKEKGISLEQLSIIPNISWKEALANKIIRFAYYLEYENERDSISVDSLKITADMLGTWQKAGHMIDYKYEYSSNTSLLVNLLTDGTYKINYGEFNVDLPNNGNNSDSSTNGSMVALPLVSNAFMLSDGYYKYRWIHNKNTKYMMISGIEASTGNGLLITHQVIDENIVDIISSKACDTLITAIFL